MNKRRNLKNIVIVGGGSAGWMTALHAKHVLPDSNITVIESDEIGILGAGEGTTPHFIPFLDFLNIPVSDLVKHASATIKNGIKFTNWTGDGSHYYHGFKPQDDLGFTGAYVSSFAASSPVAFIGNAVWEEPINNVDFVDKVSEKNKVVFLYNPQAVNVTNPIFNFDALTSFGVHFDASKLAGFLKEVGISRGINRVEGIVDTWKQDDLGDIEELTLASGATVPVDFMFDCTGFKRVFIGGVFKSKWISYQDYLPVNRAVPFFLPADENPPAYTESIAMKYGWMWKIPLQNRYGCGYVFDSDLITEEEAVKEIEEYLGFEPHYPRATKGGFKFDAGYYDSPWSNNCIALGLSSGFIEPLEATSLWVTIRSLQDVFCNVEQLTIKDPRVAEDFNKKFRSTNSQISDFLYFHYMSKRKDTEFWKKFTCENAPETLKPLLKSWEYRVPHYLDHLGLVWNLESWMVVAAGIGQLNLELLKESAEVSPAYRYGVSLYPDLKKKQDLVAESCVSHSYFLEWLKQ
jgi:tryptophan halogenase